MNYETPVMNWLYKQSGKLLGIKPADEPRYLEDPGMANAKSDKSGINFRFPMQNRSPLAIAALGLIEGVINTAINLVKGTLEYAPKIVLSVVIWGVSLVPDLIYNAVKGFSNIVKIKIPRSSANTENTPLDVDTGAPDPAGSAGLSSSPTVDDPEGAPSPGENKPPKDTIDPPNP